MIITVTMNPAIDQTAELGKLRHGCLNRIKHFIVDAGGKGINVSRTIKMLGEESLATGFLGKEGSSIILDCLKKEGIANDFVLVEGATRTNLKVMESDGTLTEINEQGMTVPQEKVEELLDKLEDYAGEDVWFVLAGSIPNGVEPNIYARIIRRVKPKGAKVFVDADGELLAKAIKAVPDMIKPNEAELVDYFGLQGEAFRETLAEYGKKLQKKGIETVAISRGGKGAVFLDSVEERVICCEALPVEVHSTVGAGDAMAAALVYAKEKKLPWEESVRLAMAVSAAAVTTAGTKPAERSVVEELLNV